jgi:hypothetical protein
LDRVEREQGKGGLASRRRVEEGKGGGQYGAQRMRGGGGSDTQQWRGSSGGGRVNKGRQGRGSPVWHTHVGWPRKKGEQARGERNKVGPTLNE